MGILDQIIAQNLMQNTPSVNQAINTFNQQQDALRMRQLQGQVAQNIEAGDSLLGQSKIFAQMAAIDPQKAYQMQSMFSTISKEQVADTFASVPLALTMDYDQATRFWENKKREYPNNPAMQEQIDAVIMAPPKDRARIYDGMLSLGGDIGVLPKRQAATEKPLQKGEQGLVFNPNTGEMTIDPVYAENQKQLNAITLEQKKKEKQLEVEAAKAKERAKGMVAREKELIQSGVDAAESVSTLKRADKLLDLVDTGKPQQAINWAKKMLGIQGANEAELENKLGQRILQQLKPIFGAQFTVSEGQWLKDMESSFGTSTEANRRLIRSGLQIAEERARKGMSIAEKANDYDTAQNIKEWLEWEYSDTPIGATTEPEQPATQAGGLTAAELQELQELEAEFGNLQGL